MPTTNYAVQYQQALANAFPKVLHFGALWRAANASKYKVVDAKTIKLPVLDTTGRVEGSRGTINGPSMRHSNDWETKELSNHRKWDTLVHPVDIQQTNMVLTIQNITKAYNEQQKFQEMDCYVSSKLYTDWEDVGGTANSDTLTKENILEYVDEEMERMDEAFVPRVGRILYVTPTAHKIIKNSQDLRRSLSATDRAVNRSIDRIDDLNIEVIPSALMKTLYDFTVGAKPATGAKQIDMMFLHPDAVLPVQQYAAVMLSEPSAVTEGKYVYFEEAFEDIFILNRRKDAMAFHVTAPKATSNKDQESKDDQGDDQGSEEVE